MECKNSLDREKSFIHYKVEQVAFSVPLVLGLYLYFFAMNESAACAYVISFLSFSIIFFSLRDTFTWVSPSTRAVAA